MISTYTKSRVFHNADYYENAIMGFCRQVGLSASVHKLGTRYMLFWTEVIFLITIEGTEEMIKLFEETFDAK